MVDRGVGDLREAPLEVVEQRTLPGGEDGVRGVIPHRADGFLAVLHHRAQEMDGVFVRVGEGALQPADFRSVKACLRTAPSNRSEPRPWGDSPDVRRAVCYDSCASVLLRPSYGPYGVGAFASGPARSTDAFPVTGLRRTSRVGCRDRHPEVAPPESSAATHSARRREGGTEQFQARGR